MAEDKNMQGFSDESLKNMQTVRDAMASVEKSAKATTQALQKSDDIGRQLTDSFKVIDKLAGSFSNAQLKAESATKGTAAAFSKAAEANKEVLKFQQKSDELLRKASSMSGEAQHNTKKLAESYSAAADHSKVVAKEFEQLAESSAALNNKTRFFTGISELIGDIPGLRKLSGPFKDAAESSRQAVLHNAKNTKQISIMGAGMKGFTKSAMASATSFLKSGGYIGLIVKGLVEVVKLGLAADREVTTLGKSLGISYEQATLVRNEFRGMSTDANELFINNEKRIKSLLELNKAFGTASTGISEDLIDNQIRLTDAIGLSADSAQQLNKQILLSGDSADSFNSSVVGASIAIQAAENVSIDTREIFNDIANTSNTIRLNYLGSNKELAKAASLARRYGMNLSMIDSLAGNLLDFESSISAELEAELLTGRQLNFERARAAALQNDYATLTSEIAKNIGTAADFSRMDRLSQEAIAKAVGMTRDQLADTLAQQRVLNLIGAKEEDSMKRRLELAMQKYTTEEEARKALTDQVFNNLKQQSIQEDFNNLLQNAKQLLVEILGGPMSNILKNFTENKEAVTDLINGFREFGQTVMNIGTVLDAVIVKPISAVVNALRGTIGLITAGGKILSGDFASGLQKGAEGFTNISTAVGNALDIGTNLLVGLSGSGRKNFFTDIGKGKIDFLGNSVRQETPLATGGIVTQPTRALVGEAGSEAVIPLREFYAKMDQMIAAVKEGKTINLDGRRVNEGLFLATSKFDRR